MKVGFTGTRDGMTTEQIASFVEVVTKINIGEFHHGDCLGSDKEAHDQIKQIYKDAHIVIHTPLSKDYRAFCKGDIETKPKPYLDRNKDIVDDSEILIATPGGKEKLRSGTWSTIRYGRRKNKTIYIIYPNGQVDSESHANK